MRYVTTTLLTAIVLILAASRPAVAIPQFYDVFKKDYLADHPDKKYVAVVDKASNRCFVCHQGKKSRKNKNTFGALLVGKLDRKKDSKNVEKISEQLKKALALHVDPKDEKSETYLDRVKASKWPAGELKDLMKEPKKDENKDAKETTN